MKRLDIDENEMILLGGGIRDPDPGLNPAHDHHHETGVMRHLEAGIMINLIVTIIVTEATTTTGEETIETEGTEIEIDGMTMEKGDTMTVTVKAAAAAADTTTNPVEVKIDS